MTPVAAPSPGRSRMGLRRLLKHTSTYSVGMLLTTMASIISFPIFTRLFSVSDYGRLGLINATIGFLVTFGKLGLQNSLLRFHAEMESGKSSDSPAEFYATIFFGMAGAGAVIASASAALFLFTSRIWWQRDAVAPLIAAASPLILVRVLDSTMLNLLRAEQRSAYYSAYTAIRKYLVLGIVLLVLLLLMRNLWGFVLASTLAEAAALAFLIQQYARRHAFQIRYFSRPLFVSMLVFALPLLASELSVQLLNVGGRYIIDFELGTAALGVYSAAYNFCDYLQSVLTAAFAQAIVPMYLRLWETQGARPTQDFLHRALRYYVMAALPVLAGMTAIGPETLRVLASARYTASGPLFALIVASMLVSGGTPIFNAGIHIHKRTRLVMYGVITAAFLNLVLTLLLAPRLGIEGAALATLISLCWYAGLTGRWGRQALRINLPWGSILHYGALSIIMFVAVRLVPTAPTFLRLMEQISIGLILYASMLFVTDASVRSLVMGRWRDMRRKAA